MVLVKEIAENRGSTLVIQNYFRRTPKVQVLKRYLCQEKKVLDSILKKVLMISLRTVIVNCLQ